jgi:hypothetical protein
MFSIRVMRQDWKDYNPTKTTLFWLCMASVALTIFVGFKWGGWVTGGGARDMVTQATSKGRAELAAAVCVDRFMNAPDAQAQLVSFNQVATWMRRRHLEDAGWVTLPGSDKPVASAGEICATQLAVVKPLASLPDAATTVQQ